MPMSHDERHPTSASRDGLGFGIADSEIDPYSPAGTVERFGEFSRGLSRRRWGKVVVWILLGVFVLIPAVSYLIVLLVGRH